jgi:hypothetical protein
MASHLLNTAAWVARLDRLRLDWWCDLDADLRVLAKELSPEFPPDLPPELMLIASGRQFAFGPDWSRAFDQPPPGATPIPPQWTFRT